MHLLCAVEAPEATRVPVEWCDVSVAEKDEYVPPEDIQAIQVTLVGLVTWKERIVY